MAVLFDEILAQPGAITGLSRALENKRLAHAYLFEGPSGVGKQKTALALAATAICRAQPPGCGKCNACRRAREGLHPDVRVFEPRLEGDHNIQVEYLREEVLPYTRYAPFESEIAFLIFPQADVSFPEQHPEAANALLKTLEEPRLKLHFFLLAERPDRLLPTIRSRCQRVRFRPLPATVIDGILQAEGVAEKARRAAIALADGRADRALELAREGKAERMLALATRIDAAVRKEEPVELLDLSEELAHNQDLMLILETLTGFYRDQAADALGLPRDYSPIEPDASKPAPLSDKTSVGEATERVRLIQHTRDAIERNANRQIALDALLFQLNQTGVSARSE